jgi:hypothetical protein
MAAEAAIAVTGERTASAAEVQGAAANESIAEIAFERRCESPNGAVTEQGRQEKKAPHDPAFAQFDAAKADWHDHGADRQGRGHRHKMLVVIDRMTISVSRRLPSRIIGAVSPADIAPSRSTPCSDARPNTGRSNSGLTRTSADSCLGSSGRPAPTTASIDTPPALRLVSLRLHLPRTDRPSKPLAFLTSEPPSANLSLPLGEVAERLNAPVSKTDPPCP